MAARAAEIIYNLSRVEPYEGGRSHGDGRRGQQRAGGGGDRRQEGGGEREGLNQSEGDSGSKRGPKPLCDVIFDRSDPRVKAEAVEIGFEVGLSDRQLAQLMGLPGTVGAEETIEDRVRAALWGKIVGFRNLFMETMMHEVKEPAPRRWRPYSRRVDPPSVARAPDDPRRWMEQALETVMVVEQEGEAGGFSKLVMLVDCSGSTGAFYGDRTVLGYIKDAAYGLLAYAKQFSLPVAVIAFNGITWLLSPESRDYLAHARKIFTLRSTGGTDLAAAVKMAAGLKPREALVAVITDGLVRRGDLDYLVEQAGANRVVAAVVSNEEGIRRMREAAGRIHIYVVKPDETREDDGFEAAGGSRVGKLLRAGGRMVAVFIYARRECASCRWLRKELLIVERLSAPPNAKLMGKCTRLNNVVLENNGSAKNCRLSRKRR